MSSRTGVPNTVAGECTRSLNKIVSVSDYTGYRLYLHGLVVKTEKGTRFLNSSVMCSAKGGLEMKIQHTFESAHLYSEATLEKFCKSLDAGSETLTWAR